MKLKELHEKYGQATIQLKVLTGQVQQLEQAIVEEMKKSNGTAPVLEEVTTESESDEHPTD